MKISRLTALFWASLLTLTAGSFAQTDSANNLAGTSWQLVQFKSSDDTILKPEGKAVYTLAFGADGHLSVRIDCNRGMGPWTSPGPSQLHLGPIALTRAMCPPSALNNRLPRDLEHVRSYVFRDGHLFLALKIDSGIYEFEPLSAASSTEPQPTPQSATPLENTHWKLTQLGTTSVPTDPHTEPYIILDAAEHRVSGFAGCNRIIGGYTLDGSKLKFPHLGASMMACISGMETEQAFLKALNQVNSWKITGDKLQLFDASGAAVASLQAAPMKQ